jgi:ABC-type amino acid transport substrate-binding protein
MLLSYINRNRKVFLFFTCISLCTVLTFTVFSSAGCRAAVNDYPETESDQTKLRVGTDPTYPIFEFAKNGKTEGFDIDIAKEIAKRMERELELISIDWESSYRIPEEPELDMIISAIPISAEKESIVDFSEPYFTMEYMLISFTETEIRAREDLIGGPVGILNIEKSYLNEDYLLDFSIKEYNDISAMINDLKSRTIDGMLLSLPMSVTLITGDTGIYRVLEIVESGRDFAIVFNKGSTLREEVNAVIEEIKQDGTYEEIYNKWFSYDS